MVCKNTAMKIKPVSRSATISCEYVDSTPVRKTVYEQIEEEQTAKVTLSNIEAVLEVCGHPVTLRSESEIAGKFPPVVAELVECFFSSMVAEITPRDNRDD